MTIKKPLLLASFFVIAFCLVGFTACEKEPETIEPTFFSIGADKVLIADRNGNIQVDVTVEPGNTYPLDISFKSSDKKVATATLGAIGGDGSIITAAERQAEKERVAEDDEEAAAKIDVPTGTAVITAKGYGECEITGTIGGFSDKVKVIVADKRVALTFDDGACDKTSKLLNGLKEEGVKATFYIVGQMTKRDDTHMDALKQAIEEGHEIGNHTYSHNAGAATLKDELAKTDDLIISLGGKKTTTMRPPGGQINSGTRKCGKAIIMWSLDTLDWKHKNPDSVEKSILNAKDGDIVLLHDLHKTTVKGTLQAIPKLKKKGFYMVTVTEMLGNPKPNKEYREGKKKELETMILEPKESKGEI